MSTETRIQFYRARLARVYGRPLMRGDAEPVARILKAERRLGLRLPAAMRDFYLVAGRAQENLEHNRLAPPQHLEVEGRYLVFMEENQGVVDWGLRVSTIAAADPNVWQRVNDDPPKWYSERMPFSIFILKNLAWQRGVTLSRVELQSARRT
jgi:hypothetical protein